MHGPLRLGRAGALPEVESLALALVHQHVVAGPELAALVADMLEEIDSLRARLRSTQPG